MWLLIEFNHISHFKCYQHFDFVSSYQLRYIVQATQGSFKIQRFSLIKIQPCLQVNLTGLTDHFVSFLKTLIVRM